MTHSVWHFISITESLAKARGGGMVARGREKKESEREEEEQKKPWRLALRFSCFLTVNK